MYGIQSQVRLKMSATERLEVRIDPEDKALLAKAAVLEGVKLSTFVVGPALERARRLVRESEQILTTERGFQNLLEALDNPPEPTPALRAAMRKHKKSGL
jgi:uncharacterized protein (DUF1778 family)